MNKLLVALGLAATVALVGCNKDKAPETDNQTTDQNVVDQTAASVGAAVEIASDQIDAAADYTSDAAAEAATKTEDAAREATAKTAGAVESTAADVKEKAQQ